MSREQGARTFTPTMASTCGQAFKNRDRILRSTSVTSVRLGIIDGPYSAVGGFDPTAAEGDQHFRTPGVYAEL
jgi:hypothetical protein